MNRTMRSEAGYSLAEMLTVVAIIGVLALVMVPNFMTFYQSNKMKASMRNFTTDLRSARQLAITRGRQSMLSFPTGTSQRAYNWYLGNAAFNSTSWTAQTGPGTNRPTKTLDDIVYFPTSGQTFTDVVSCTTLPCTAGTDSQIDVIFFPDGRVQLPTSASAGTIIIKTDLNKLPKTQYSITISPSGRVMAQ